MEKKVQETLGREAQKIKETENANGIMELKEMMTLLIELRKLWQKPLLMKKVDFSKVTLCQWLAISRRNLTKRQNKIWSNIDCKIHKSWNANLYYRLLAITKTITLSETGSWEHRGQWYLNLVFEVTFMIISCVYLKSLFTIVKLQRIKSLHKENLIKLKKF